MTRLQKTLLIVSIILYLSGGLFKIMHWPFSFLMMTSGILILTLVFLPILIISRFENKPTGKRLYYYLSGFISIYVILIGKFFEVLGRFEDFGGLLQLLGLIVLIFIFLPLSVSLWRHSSDHLEKKKYKNRIIIVLSYLIFVIIMTIITAIF